MINHSTDWNDVPLVLTIEDFIKVCPSIKSRQTVMKYINEGKLKGQKIGNKYQILKEDAFEFVNHKTMIEAEREEYSVLDASGNYKRNVAFDTPKIILSETEGCVFLLYHNPDCLSGDQFVKEMMSEEQYLRLWNNTLNINDGKISEDAFEAFSDAIAARSWQFVADAEDAKGAYCTMKQDWCSPYAKPFNKENAEMVAKLIKYSVEVSMSM